MAFNSSNPAVCSLMNSPPVESHTLQNRDYADYTAPIRGLGRARSTGLRLPTERLTFMQETQGSGRIAITGVDFYCFSVARVSGAVGYLFGHPVVCSS